MAKTFYTDRDIEDLFSRGVASLVINDDVVVTDLAREKAMKLGMELVRELDNSPSAPERPYIAKQSSPNVPLVKEAIQKPDKAQLQDRVHKAVMARLGDSADPKLLETIISRVLKSVGGS